MLLRFLSIATVSVTLLTAQAINSTETKSSLPENTIQSEEESIFSDQATFEKLYLKKEETDFDLSQKVNSQKLIKTNLNIKDQPTIVIASIGQIPISLPEASVKERPSYLPPIAFIADKEDSAIEQPKPPLTAKSKTKSKSKHQNNQFASIIQLEKQKTKLKKKKSLSKKLKRTKKIKRKYTKTKKYRKVKYSLGKKVRKAKAKRKRYNRHYKPAKYYGTFGIN